MGSATKRRRAAMAAASSRSPRQEIWRHWDQRSGQAMFEGRSVLVVVPARGGSVGVKLKNLREVGGVSLVARAGQVAQVLDFVDRAIVSTDHPEIARAAEQAGLS